MNAVRIFLILLISSLTLKTVAADTVLMPTAPPAALREQLKL